MIEKGNGKAGATKLASILIAALVALGTLTSCAGTEGPKGENGIDGKSAYEIAVENGYNGTEAEWLISLVGENGKDGRSAYELAVEDGYKGTLEEWFLSIVGKDGAAGLNGKDGTDGKSAYELAVENGYKGTLSQWLESLVGNDGKDGIDGITGRNGKSAYEIAVENGFDGGVTEWLASLIGEDGKGGSDGKSAYELAVENGYTGTVNEWLSSLIGENGSAGNNGKSAYEVAKENGYTGTEAQWLASLAGKSAYDLAVENGYSGTLQEWLASLVGAAGAAGAQGEQGEKGEQGDAGSAGKSAYEIAKENGYTGTEAEWLASLTGLSAYQVAVKNGYTGTEAEWLASLVGEAGQDGLKGNDGKSAYEIAKENGYTGTVEQWLATLIGPTGAAGAAGKDGSDGKSAYELAVENGYSGTIADWLTSLVGAAGAAGAQGEKGEDGKDGKDGVSVVGAYIDENTHLILKLSNDTTIDAGYVGVEAPIPEYYTVRFCDFDGSEIKVIENVAAGSSVTPPADPTREGYIFTGWSGSYTNITESVTLVAQYVPAESTIFTVTFVDWDGTELKKQTVNKGESAEAPEEPARTGYRFVRWDKSFDNVTADMTITAVYVRQYTVVFEDKDGNVLKTETVDEGTNATPPAVPEVEGYTFVDWVGNYNAVTQDEIVTAKYVENAPATFTVTFVDWDGNELKSETVQKGMGATAPADPTREGYAFKGWDKAFDNVTGDMTVTAVYEEITEPTIVVSSAAAHPGDTVEITIKLLNSPQLLGMSFKIHFDDTSLELVSATNELNSAVLRYTKPAKLENGANFLWFANDPVEANGLVLTMSFMVKESASLGEHSVAMTCNSDNTFDFSGSYVEIKSVAGTIEVTN